MADMYEELDRAVKDGNRLADALVKSREEVLQLREQIESLGAEKDKMVLQYREALNEIKSLKAVLGMSEKREGALVIDTKPCACVVVGGQKLYCVNHKRVEEGHNETRSESPVLLGVPDGRTPARMHLPTIYEPCPICKKTACGHFNEPKL